MMTGDVACAHESTPHKALAELLGSTATSLAAQAKVPVLVAGGAGSPAGRG